MHREARGSTSVFNLEPFDGIKCSFPRSGGMEILGWLWQLGAPAPATGNLSWPAAPAPLSGGPSAAGSEGHNLSLATGATRARTHCGHRCLLDSGAPTASLGFIGFFFPPSFLFFSLYSFRSVSLSSLPHFSLLFLFPVRTFSPITPGHLSHLHFSFSLSSLLSPPSPPGAAPARQGGLCPAPRSSPEGPRRAQLCHVPRGPPSLPPSSGARSAAEPPPPFEVRAEGRGGQRRGGGSGAGGSGGGGTGRARPSGPTAALRLSAAGAPGAPSRPPPLPSGMF